MNNYLKNNQFYINEMKEKYNKEKEIIENETKRKIELFEKQKLELELIKTQKQQELEEIIKKEKIAEEKSRQKKQMIEKKKALIQKQKQERENLLHHGDSNPEYMEQLILSHQIELQEIENAINKERERQINNMNKKLAEKRIRKIEYKSCIDQLKTDKDKWAAEIEDLPGITNIQAATLLLKWRRNPKKGIKEIKKSIMVNDSTKKAFPTVVCPPVKSKGIAFDKRIEEIAEKIKQIEDKVGNLSEIKMNEVHASLDFLTTSVQLIG